MKNKISYLITSTIFLLICVSLTSCYTNYYGIYRIGKFSPSFKLTPASDEDNKKIYELVKNIALDYGFIQLEKGKYDKPEHIGFGKFRDNKGKHEELEGSEGPFSIALLLKSHPSVSIEDSGRIYESEFMKSLKNELEKRLSEVVDMNGVVFDRQLTPFN
jgi:hypothetical protein